MAAFILTDIQKVSASISILDAAGNPAVVDGAPVWASSDESVLTVVVAPDGLSAEITAVGPLGTAQVSVSADADLGEGVASISGVQDFEVQASAAVSIGIAVGTPESK